MVALVAFLSVYVCGDVLESEYIASCLKISFVIYIYYIYECISIWRLQTIRIVTSAGGGAEAKTLQMGGGGERGKTLRDTFTHTAK